MGAPSVTIIDYGIGNLRSIEKAFEAVGAAVQRTDDPQRIDQADRVVLPGVGAFGACMAELERRRLVAPIRAFAASGRPFLGVCIGMQLLFEKSTELGEHAGLGLLPGRVVRFDFSDVARKHTQRLKIPHMGWNAVDWLRRSPLTRGIETHAHFYFVHSYYARPERPEDVIGAANYGGTFPAVVGNGNVFGAQFHPEKSQRHGLDILRNFGNLTISGLVDDSDGHRYSVMSR